MRIYLMDGPLMGLQNRRLALVEEMANILLQCEAYDDAAEARRVLRAFGYSMLDIEVLLDDVRQAAMQHQVTSIMEAS